MGKKTANIIVATFEVLDMLSLLMKNTIALQLSHPSTARRIFATYATTHSVDQNQAFNKTTDTKAVPKQLSFIK